jgi:hypothetical protein
VRRAPAFDVALVRMHGLGTRAAYLPAGGWPISRRHLRCPEVPQRRFPIASVLPPSASAASLSRINSEVNTRIRGTDRCVQDAVVAAYMSVAFDRFEQGAYAPRAEGQVLNSDRLNALSEGAVAKV